MKKALLGLTCTAALLASAAPAWAWTSMSVPGNIYNANTWSPGAQPLPSHSGTVWSGDITVDKNGDFKFAANGSWNVSWGGDGVSPTILRFPATDVGPLTSNGGKDIALRALSGDSSQTLRFSFDDTNLVFSISGSGAPSVSSARLVGAFNDYGNTEVGTLTNTSGSIWTADIPLSSGADLALRVNGDESDSWGAPLPANAAAPLKIPLCGNIPANIDDFRPGVFRVTFDASDLTLSVVQLSTNEFNRAGIAAEGPLSDIWESRKSTPAPQDFNLAPDGDLYTGDFWFDSKRTFTLSFSERDADGNRGGLFWSAASPSSATINPDAIWSGAYNAVASSRNAASNTLTAPVAGLYRITFNPANGLATAQCLYGRSDGVNLFSDPSFETLSTPDWGNWYLHNATNYFGTNAPSIHTGNGVAALQQRQTEDGDYGIVSGRNWITVSNNVGSTLRVSAWMAAFNDWSADRTRIWIEFYDADGQKFDEAENVLTQISSSWRPYTLEAEIPEGAVSANLLFSYQGANGGSGELLIDDAEAVITSSRRLTFDSWGKISNRFQSYAPGGAADWSVSWGRTTNNASDLHIEPGAVFISKYIEGTNNNKAIELFNASTAPVNLSGWTLQQYNNGATTPSTNFALSGTVATGACFLVTRTFDDPVPITNTLQSASDLQFYGLTFNGDDAIVLRDPSGNIVDRVGQVRTNITGSLLAYVMRDHTLVRSPYTAHGTTNAVTEPFPYDEWEILPCDDYTGLKAHSRALPPDIYMPSGLSLVLDGDATLTSPRLDGGIGDVSFWYRTAFPESAHVSGSATLVVEASLTSDFASPTNIAEIVVAATNYSFQQFSVMADLASYPYFRIRSANAVGDALARIDDLYVGTPIPASRYQDFNLWTQPSWAEYVGNYSLGGWAIAAGRTTLTNGLSSTPAAVLPKDATVTSPALEAGAGIISFWAAAESADEPSYAVAVEKSTDGGVTWSRVGTPFAGTNTAWVSYETSASVPSDAVIRFVSTGANPAMVDNIRIELPEEDSRNQDFNAWPATSGYTSGSFQGWSIASAMIATDSGVDGTKGFRAKSSGAYILSPELAGGLGVFSFLARPYSASHSPGFKVEVSTNGASSWKTVLTNRLDGATSVEWSAFSVTIDDESVTHVRISSTVSATLCLDSIVCGKILPPPSMTVYGALDPALPYPDEAFRFTAFVNPVGGASQRDIVSVTANYKTRVEGRLTPGSIALTNSAGQWFSSELSGLPNGSTITYSIAVAWTNNGNTVTNSSDQQTVAIDALASGGVWINEVFFTANEELDTGDFWGTTEDHEFVEICGPAGTDLTGWKLEFQFANTAEIARNGGKDTYATYRFAATNTTPASALKLSDQANGYGFFVVGDPCSEWRVNVNLTSNVPAGLSYLGDPECLSDHIHDGEGVIRLLHGNTVVHSVSYKRNVPGTTSYIKDQSDPWRNTNSISATGGPGWCATNFSWSSKAGLTVGAANLGQSFTNRETSSKTLPEFVFHDPDLLIVPDKAGETSFFMLDPWPPTVTNLVYFNLGYPASYPESDGVVYIRHHGETDYTTSETGDIRGSAQSGTNSFMVWGPFAKYTWKRLDTIEYYFSFKPRANTYSIAFVGVDESGESHVYASEADAQAHPFSYTFPFHDSIEFISIDVPANPDDRIIKAVFYDPDYTQAPSNTELSVEALSGSLVNVTNWSKLAHDLDGLYEATNQTVSGDGTYYYIKFDRTNSPAFYRITPSLQSAPADVP